MFLLMEEENEIINLDKIITLNVFDECLVLCYEADEDNRLRKKLREISYCDKEHAEAMFNEICEGIKSGAKIIEI